MKVGDYVRIKGIIRKIDTIGYQDDTYISFTEDNTTLVYKSIIKSSQDITDLIEAGDYVNGMKVYEVFKHPEVDDVREHIVAFCDEVNKRLFSIYGDEIKSIVTHEQFSQMEYKIC